MQVTGRVPDVRSYLAYARAAVAPIRIARGVQNKVLKAMAQGRLFIASDVGGHQELIRDGETGMLFRAGDIKALAGVRWKRCIWPMAGSATGYGAALRGRGAQLAAQRGQLPGDLRPGLGSRNLGSPPRGF